MLVANGADSRDPSAQMTIAEAVAQQSSAGSDAGLLQGTSLAHSIPFDGDAGHTDVISFTNLPVRLTSQGLM